MHQVLGAMTAVLPCMELNFTNSAKFKRRQFSIGGLMSPERVEAGPLTSSGRPIKWAEHGPDRGPLPGKRKAIKSLDPCI